MTTKDKVNIGIIGTGVGLRTHLPGFRRNEGANVLAIVGSSEPRAKEFAQKHEIPLAFGDYKDLCNLPEIDLVCVTTPNDRHFEEVKYALSKGKHVLAEKPLGMNLSETEELARIARKAKKLAFVDHQLRFNPYIQKTRSLISSGALGRIYYVQMHQQSTGFSNREAPWIWSFEEERGGGVRLAMASHLIDLTWFLFGVRKVYSVRGAMDVVVPKRKDLQGKEHDVKVSSFFNVSLALENNLEAQLTATAAAIGMARFDFSVYGTEGELHFDLENKLNGAFLGEKGMRKIDVEGVTPEEAANKVSIFSGSFVYFAPKIIDAVKLGNADPIKDAATFDQAIHTQKILDSIVKSTLSGNSIKLDGGYKPGALY